MDQKEILKFCIEKGLLIDKEVLNLLSDTKDIESVQLVMEKIRECTKSRIITKSLLENNKEIVKDLVLDLPKESQEKLEKLKIKLGIEIEISKKISENSPSEEIILKNTPLLSSKDFVSSKESPDYTSIIHQEERKKDIIESEENKKVIVLSKKQPLIKKIEVGDFVKNLRNRFSEMKEILQEHRDLNDLVSINKLSSQSKKVSIIGMVSQKKVTKNKNLMFEVEDLTGKIKVIINQNKPEIYALAEEISLDTILGFSGFGDQNIFFVNNIILPDISPLEKKHSPIEEYALFIGDLHYGSKLFMEENFKKFIRYINGEVSNTNLDQIKKIKYLFILGDVVAGVGNYPSQQKDLYVEDIEEQFQGLANLLGKIRKDIQIIISPGNHDGVRLMEPQPPLDEKYAWPLYNLKNLIFTPNPSYVNIGADKRLNFSGFDVLTYHGFSYAYYANNIPSLIEKGLNAPDKIMIYLLKNRHLAPTNSSVQYFPHKIDELLIKKVPDIFVSGHTHKMEVSSYKGVLIISTSTWEQETSYNKRKGNTPDFCKVPMLNTKTRSIKILDFE
ncbi:metallophosphoesterase [Patescibacteria group bacterium]|nr:metallophosphoesterase [Patescibacteria group bacterium]